MKMKFMYILTALLFSCSNPAGGGGASGGGTSGGGGSAVTVPFVSVWKTDNSGATNSNQIQLPFISTGSYNCTVDWGDGKTDVITQWNSSAVTHTYSVAGSYTVSITGLVTGFSFPAASNGDTAKIIDIKKWGCLRLGNCSNGYFANCSNLNISATDILDLTGTTDLSFLFRCCSKLSTVPSIGSWDTSKVTNMTQVFTQCLLFNLDVSTWDTSNVTEMREMFSYATLFNQPIGAWNTAKVGRFDGMFWGASAFNQNLGSWKVSALDTTKVIYGFEFTDTAISDANYSAILTGWGAQTVPTGIKLVAKNSKYTAASASARSSLVTKGWIITDAGPQ